MPRHLLSLLAVGFALFATATTSATVPTIDDYRVGVVRYFFKPMGDFNSSDMLVRMAEPGERSKVVDLSHKRGKVLMLTFWNRTCQLCRRNLKRLNELQQKVGKDKLEIIAANGSINKPFARIERAFERLRLSELTMVQPRGIQIWQEMQNRIAYELSRGYPPTWIIDPQGEIRFLSDVAMDWANAPEVVALVEALANGDV